MDEARQRQLGAERAPPPRVGSASKTTTDQPAWARAVAAARPLGPLPTTDRQSGDGHDFDVGPATIRAARCIGLTIIHRPRRFSSVNLSTLGPLSSRRRGPTMRRNTPASTTARLPVRATR